MASLSLALCAAPQRPAICLATAPARTAARRPARRAQVAPRAAKAVPIVYQATGVPLVDELMQLATVKDAVLSGSKLIAVAAVGVALGSLVLSRVDDAIDAKGGARRGALAEVAASAVAAASTPASALLPFWGAAYAAKVAAAVAQVASTKMAADFDALCRGNGGAVVGAVRALAQALQDASEVVVVVGAAWAATILKDRLLAAACARADPAGTGISRVLSPLSSVLTAVIWVAGAAAALAALGVDAAPLLGSLGASSVVIGIAAQKVLGNVGSAVGLYISQPFIRGDTVRFLNGGGGLVLEGVVEAVEPLRTCLRVADGSIVFIENGMVAGWIVQNMTRK